MAHYTVNEEEIIEILSLAFEKGWSGYKDTKEAVIQELAQEFLKTKRKVRKAATKKKRRRAPPRDPSEWMIENHLENYPPTDETALPEISFQYDEDTEEEGPIIISAEENNSGHWVVPNNWDGNTITTGGNYDIHRIISGMLPPNQNEEDEEEGQ